MDFWETQDGKEVLASNLLRLAQYHRKNCDGNCTISLSLIGVLYRDLVARELTKKELETFI